MDIQIGSEASIATPPAGYRTLFINTDKGNMLYYKNSDGTFTPYTGDATGVSTDIAQSWTECLCCALKDGTITSEQYQSILDSGLEIVTNTSTDVDGAYSSSVTVGSRINRLIDITLNTSAVAKLIAQLHQITVTFNPTSTTNQNLTYITSNPALATVNSTGAVSCLGAGVVVITVIPESDPSKSKTVTITIS